VNNPKSKKGGKVPTVSPKPTHFVQRKEPALDESLAITVTPNSPDPAHFEVSITSGSSFLRESHNYAYPVHAAIGILVLRPVDLVSAP
jgi:hypothetical protein